MPRIDLSDYGLLAAVVSTCTLVQRYEQLSTGTPNPPPRIGLPCTTLIIGIVGPAIAEEILVAMVPHQCDAIAKRSLSFFPNGLADQGIDRDHNAACVRDGGTMHHGVVVGFTNSDGLRPALSFVFGPDKPGAHAVLRLLGRFSPGKSANSARFEPYQMSETST